MSSAPLTDHCLLSLVLQSSLHNNKRKTHWKFNGDLLKCDEYCNLTKDLILDIKFDSTIGSSCNRWEFFKYRVRQISIKFGKKEAKLSESRNLS